MRETLEKSKARIEKDSIKYFPNTSTEKYVWNGPHKSISNKWAQEMSCILQYRRIFIEGAIAEFTRSLALLEEKDREIADLKKEIGYLTPYDEDRDFYKSGFEHGYNQAIEELETASPFRVNRRD